jgi:hypothetical protein
MAMPLRIHKNLVWAARVLWAFLRLEPVVTVSVIACLAGSQISQVLAFFLPLKVLLLASSDGIPRVLQPIVQPEHRTLFIVVLSLGAVLFFALTLILDALAQTLTKKGGAAVLARTNKLARVSHEHAAAPRYYTQISEIAASFAFVFISIAVLAALNPLLLVVLVATTSVELTATLAILRFSNPITPGRLGNWVQDNLGDYLGLLQSLAFLSGFFALLIPFLLGQPSNILIILLSFLLLRQTLNRLKKGVQTLVKLVGHRHLVDPLAFHNRREDRPPEATPEIAFRSLFYKTARQRLAAAALDKSFLAHNQLDSEWVDPTTRGIYLFKLTDRSEDSNFPKTYLHRVFLPKQIPLLEHEEYLFRYIDRQLVNAPRVVARGSEGIFEFQVCEAGTGRTISASDWPAAALQLLIDLWSVRPKKSLVNAFLTSRPMLQGRLSASFVRRSEIAIDDESEKRVLGELLERLPELRARLSGTPIVVVNPQLTSSNTLTTPDGGHLIISWTGWRLEPMGYGAPRNMEPEDLGALAEAIASSRKLPSVEKAQEDMDLTRNSHLLEVAINGHQYKMVFTLGSRILELLDNRGNE